MNQVFFSLAFLFLSTSNVWAESNFFSSPCGIALIEAESSLKYPLNQEKIVCMVNNDDFLEAKGKLCDKTNPSIQLEKYLDHDRAYRKSFEAFRNAKTYAERVMALSEMRKAEQDWSILGYREEVSENLNLIGHAEYECRPEDQK